MADLNSSAGPGHAMPTACVTRTCGGAWALVHVPSSQFMGTATVLRRGLNIPATVESKVEVRWRQATLLSIQYPKAHNFPHGASRKLGPKASNKRPPLQHRHMQCNYSLPRETDTVRAPPPQHTHREPITLC